MEKTLALNTTTTRYLLVIAQLLALISLGFGLQFLLNTTGGTLFLFSSLGPMLTIVSSAIVLGIAVSRFRRRHSLFEFESYRPGQIICREGDTGDCAYFIESGAVEVVRNDGGAEVVVAKLGEGQYFGEMALLSNEPRNATVRAAAPTKLALLGKRNFLTMLNLLRSMRDEVLKTAQDRAKREAG